MVLSISNLEGGPFLPMYAFSSSTVAMRMSPVLSSYSSVPAVWLNPLLPGLVEDAGGVIAGVAVRLGQTVDELGLLDLAVACFSAHLADELADLGESLGDNSLALRSHTTARANGELAGDGVA